MEVGAVLVWWLVVAGLFGTALPIAAWLLPTTADHGAFVALPIATVVVVLPVYWIGHLRYGPFVALLGLLGLIALSVALRRRGHVPERGRAFETFAVFTAAFLFFLAIRSVDPGAHPGGGEKFLDLGLLQSLLRSDVLPPADMWFAGESVVYYYGGHLVAATVAHVTGIAGRFAYNLALVTAYAGAVTAVYGFAGDIAARRGLDRSLAGGVGAVFFGLASNLFTVAGLLGTLIGGGFLDHLAAATGRTVEQARLSLDSFGYWWASRVIPGTVTEFPFFAYLNGDLHAHMTDTTLLLLVAAIGYAYYLTPATAIRRRQVLLFGVGPPVIGFMAVVNTWSLPAGIGLLWLALIFSEAPPWDVLPGSIDLHAVADRPIGAECLRIVVATGIAVVILPLALVWVAPYVENVLLVGSSVEGVEVLETRTGLWALLVAHGGFLLVFAWYHRRIESSKIRWIWGLAGLGVLAALGLLLIEAAVLVTVLPVGVAMWIIHRYQQLNSSRNFPGYDAVLIVAGVGLVTIVEFVFVNDAASGGRYNTIFKIYAQVWPLWATAAGVALTAAVGSRTPQAMAPSKVQWRPIGGAVLLGGLCLYALLALVEHFDPYVMVWQDWLPTILVGALVLVAIGLGIRERFGSRIPGTISTPLEAHPVLSVVLAAVLVLNGGIALAADDASVPAHEPSIDALAFVHVWHPGEAPVIEWLADREGQPHIVSAPGFGVYDWSSQAASLTGLPTVVGWSHEANYRTDAAFQDRVEDVDALFRGSPETRARLLRTYDVRYIYVGPNEESRYGTSDLSFADEPGISVAIQTDTVTLYAVNQSALIESGP